MCGCVKSERRVLEKCNVTQHVRNRYSLHVLEDDYNFSHDVMCKVVHDVLLSHH